MVYLLRDLTGCPKWDAISLYDWRKGNL